MLLNGDILGLSGIFSSTLLHPIKTAEEQPWRFCFLASFFTAAAVYVNLVGPSCIQSERMPSTLAYLIGGFLVGFGTRLSNGCTSGHGICGLARLSKRSFIAVATFMGTGILTATLALTSHPSLRSDEPPSVSNLYGFILTAVTLVVAWSFIKNNDKALGATLSAGLAAIGLGLSGMVKTLKIENFLNVGLLSSDPHSFDPTLITVMGGGVIVSWMAYQFLPDFSLILPKEYCMQAPVKHAEFNVPTSSVIDWKLIGGSASFGVGWALACLCPGPAFFHVAAGSYKVIFVWFPTYLGGSFLAESVASPLWTHRWACHSGPSSYALIPNAASDNNSEIALPVSEEGHVKELV